MKRPVGYVVLGMLLMTVGSAASADSSRIAFITKRTNPSYLHLWKMREDGSAQTEVLGGTVNHNFPSISLNGEKFVFDSDGDVYIVDEDGADETAIMSSATESYEHASVGPPASGFSQPGDFRIVFSRTYHSPDITGNPTVTEIWMAMWDDSEEAVVFPSSAPYGRITALTSAAQGEQVHPVFCGDDRVAWARDTDLGFYEREICIVEIDANGPVDDPQCYGHDSEENALNDDYPACNALGTRLAWSRARESYAGYEIYVMDCDGTDCDFDNRTPLTNDYYYNNTRPSFAPSGTYIAFASDRPVPGSEESADDMEIWTMESDGVNKVARTDNSAEDDDPDYGAAP
jgi:WD40-like Beta Propeller Repeat